MTNTSKLVGYLIGLGTIAWAVVGFLAGWIDGATAQNILFIGLAAFGIHNHNVAVAKAQGIR